MALAYIKCIHTHTHTLKMKSFCLPLVLKEFTITHTEGYCRVSLCQITSLIEYLHLVQNQLHICKHVHVL